MAVGWKFGWLAGWAPGDGAATTVSTGSSVGTKVLTPPVFVGVGDAWPAPRRKPPALIRRHGATSGVTVSTGSTVATADTAAIRRAMEDELLLVGAL